MKRVLALAAVVAALVLAAAAAAGEPAGRVLPSGQTAKGGDVGLFFDTDTLALEGLVLDWGCASKDKGKPVYETLTHAGIGHIPASRHLTLSVRLPFTKIGTARVLGKATVTVDAKLDWGPKTNAIRRATAKGTISAKSGACTTGPLAFSARNR
jgi:hypothetical protein